MNDAAQNAFLKALEEPPPSTVWVLEAEDDRVLLDTIVSRCQRLDLTTWPPAALDARARALGIPDETRTGLVRAAMGSPDRLADLAGRECPECGRVYPIGVEGRVTTTCLHHQVTCRACMRQFKGPVKIDTSRRTPCDCTVDDYDEANLEGVATELGAARERHLGVVARLAEAGPGAVPAIAADVVAWAERAMQGLAEEQEGELARLRELYGVEADRELPKGVKPQIERKHKRQQREARGRAVERFLDDFGSYLRDLLVANAGDATLVNVDHAEQLHADAGRLPVTAVVRGLEDVARCREALGEFNGHPQLQLERVLTPVAAAVFAATAPR